jgi:SAM-dependent methyltransferase
VPDPILARLFEVYEGMPRGGPGDAATARRARDLMTGLPPRPRVLDLGCGPGANTAALAALTGGRVTALDLHAPFVAGQVAAAQRAAARGGLPAGVAVDGVCANMAAVPFAAGSFDLVWSEGALYSIGFTNGLAACLALLRPGGYLAASDAVWTVPDPPDEARRWWEAEYPGISTPAAKAGDVDAAGFDVVGHFTLPQSCWRDEYYAPLRARIEPLRVLWDGDDEAIGILDQLAYEADMFDRFGHAYSYEFIVARRP